MTFKTKSKLLGAAAAGAFTLAALPAQASLTLFEPEDFQGTGIGSVYTVLTVESPANGTFEQGSVAVGAGNQQVITGDAKTGASQTTLRTLGEVGVTQASELRVVLNAVEPAPASGITVTDLVLNIYAADGSVLFSSTPFTPVDLSTTQQGIGNSGFVFGLDPAQTAAAQTAVFAGGSFSDYRVGLSATLNGATGGPETFFLAASVDGPVTSPIPEPETYAMMLAGLGVLGFMGRRRARAAADKKA